MKARLWLVMGAVLGFGVASCGGGGGGGPTGPGPGPGPGTGPTFASGNMSTTPGNNLFVRTFTEEGTWGYRCTLHLGMNGSVQVSAAGADSPSVSITNNQFTPAAVHVKTGSYVKWTTNQGIHNVTRP